MAKIKGRSEQGRGNKNKGGKTAGKGFVTPRANRSDKKAIGKALGKVAAAAVPGGLAAKGAMAIKAAKATKAAKAKDVAAKKSAAAKKDYYNKRSVERSKKNSGMVVKREIEGPAEVFMKTPATLKRKPNLPKKSK